MTLDQAVLAELKPIVEQPCLVPTGLSSPTSHARVPGAPRHINPY